MLNGAAFYHNTTRKLVTVFGNMFNDIAIQRFDKDNNKIQNIPVPIAYGSKQKYILQNNRRELDPTEKLQIQLPQLFFRVTNISTQQNRNLNATNQNVSAVPGNNRTVRTQFAQIPIYVAFELGFMVRNHDDAFQIIEQIIPYFPNGSFTNNIKLFPEMNLSFDVRTTLLEGLGMEDMYEGGTEESRYIVWTMNFEMRGWYAGPITEQGVIKRVQVDLHPVTTDEWEKSLVQSRIVARPGLTADGKPTSDPELTIPYSEINPDDPYGFINEIYFFQPGVTYDPEEGTDR